MNINATDLGYVVFGYLIFTPILVFFSYHLLKNKRQSVKSDTIVIAVLSLVPPLQLIALFAMYLKPNKQ